ncbi:MAG: hypothetical protein ACRDUA_22020, partial [Micromonosporaceae bacterium]
MSDTDDKRTPEDRVEAPASPAGARRTATAEHRAESKSNTKLNMATVRTTLRSATDLIARLVMAAAMVIALI